MDEDWKCQQLADWLPKFVPCMDWSDLSAYLSLSGGLEGALDES